MTRRKKGYFLNCQKCHSEFWSTYSEARHCKDCKGWRPVRKFNISWELLVEANNAGKTAAQKVKYITDKLGCSGATVWARMWELKYSWDIPTSRRAATRTMRKKHALFCVICGEDRVTESAHVIADCDGGKATEDNLITLCPTHHKLFDFGKLNQQESEDLEYVFANKYRVFHWRSYESAA